MNLPRPPQLAASAWTFILGLMMLCLSLGASAQSPGTFPQGTVRIVITLPPGGATDLIAREIAKGLQEMWGHPVIVESKPGASGIVGTEFVTKAAPDGHTLLLISSTALVSTPFLYDKVPYNSLTDLKPISMVAAVPNVLVVHPQLRVSTLKDFIAAAKARPGSLNYATSGKGESNHIAMEALQKAADARLTEIPYRGGAPAVVALLAGEVQASWLAVSTAMPHLKSGKLLALAVSSPERAPQLPDIPSVIELGYSAFEAAFNVGILGPGGLTPALTAKIQQDIQTVARSAAYRERVLASGNLVMASTSEEFSKLLQTDMVRYRNILAPDGVKKN